MVTVMRIILQPLLFQLDKDIVSSLEKAISEEFNPSSIITTPPIKEIPEQLLLFDDQRNQWKSNDILQWLSYRYNKPSSKATKILAICDFDAFSGALNFVFGQAYLDLQHISDLSSQTKTGILWIKTKRICLRKQFMN